jgi:hypothetical protein
VITEYLAPTAAAPGRARGTLDLTFRVRGGEFAGEVLPATGTFTVPLNGDGS